MRKILLFVSGFFLLTACGDSNAPDVSGIDVKLETSRFERDFFKVDTNQLIQSLQNLDTKYPGFLQDFISGILGLPAQVDTSIHAQNGIKSFIATYKPIYDSAEKTFPDFDAAEKEIKQGLQYVKHYFPAYQTPNRIITFIGPVDGYGNVLIPPIQSFAIGLQSYLGKDFFLYNSEMVRTIYPSYITRRFSKEYIPVNSMRNIINEIYPPTQGSISLVEAMVEKGKEIYVLDKLLPNSGDSLKIGYTENQLQGCYKNEGLIWNFFLTNNLLNSIDADVHKNYLDEGPNTPEFGEGAPGFIGGFVGWQIVKKWMENNPNTKLPQLLQTEARKIFEESKYRPK